MRYYFSKITADHWIAKNKLHEAALRVAKEMEWKLIPVGDMPKFEKEFKDKIDAINSQFSRCNPLVLDIYTDPIERRSKDICFNIYKVFSLSLYWAKDEIDLDIVM
jgi:hypothetical protein